MNSFRDEILLILNTVYVQYFYTIVPTTIQVESTVSNNYVCILHKT